MYEDVVNSIVEEQKKDQELIKYIEKNLKNENGLDKYNEYDLKVTSKTCDPEDLFSQLLITRSLAQGLLNLHRNSDFYKDCYFYTHMISKAGENIISEKKKDSLKVEKIIEIIIKYMVIRKLLLLAEDPDSPRRANKKSIKATENKEICDLDLDSPRFVIKENIKATENTIICEYCDHENSVDRECCDVCQGDLRDINLQINTKKVIIETRSDVRQDIVSSGSTRQTMARSSNQKDTSSRICPTCTMINDSGGAQCRHCITPRYSDDKSVHNIVDEEESLRYNDQRNVPQKDKFDGNHERNDKVISRKEENNNTKLRETNRRNMPQNDIYDDKLVINDKEISTKYGSMNTTTTYPRNLDDKETHDVHMTQNTWPCPGCTFVNRLDNDTCEVCFTNRNNLQDHRDEVMTGLYDDLSANRKQPDSNTIREYKSEISNNTTEFKSLSNIGPHIPLRNGGKNESTKCLANFSHKASDNTTKKPPLNNQQKERNKDNIKDSLKSMPPMHEKQSYKDVTKNYQSPRQKIEKSSDIVKNYSSNDTITSDTVTIVSNSAVASAKLSVPQHWSCTSCTFNNKLSNKCCEVCFTIPPMDLSSDITNDTTDRGDITNDSSDSGDITNDTSDSGDITNDTSDSCDIKNGTSDSFYVTDVPPETWKCKKCKCDNLFDKYICGKCRDYAPFFRKWVCEQCSFFNEELSPQCAVCDYKNRNLIKCIKCKRNNVNINVGRECDTCSTKVTVTSDTTMDGWIEVRRRKCVTCNNKVTATEGIFCKICSKKTYYCNNRWCGNINSNKSVFCRKCKLKKGSNINDYNLADVHDGNKFSKKWQCTFCGLLNTSVKCCDKCKNIRRKGPADKKCQCNWINKSNANKCDKCFLILPKDFDK